MANPPSLPQPPDDKPPSRSYALEISLVALAIVAAFGVQYFLKSTQPPKLPEMDEVKRKLMIPNDAPTVSQHPDSEKQQPRQLEYHGHLSDLASAPDWQTLDDYQYTITKERFLHELASVYTFDGTWREWITIGDDSAIIRSSSTADEDTTFELFFATAEKQRAIPRYWRAIADIPRNNADLPLYGVRIAIDPGHIGGNYASVEERSFTFKGSKPVQEGDLTLMVAELLRDQLGALGAEVFMTRSDTLPVNPLRPKDYVDYAQRKLRAKGLVNTQDALKRASNKLFYRAGEIKQRAHVINDIFMPDLAIALHFNATAWEGKALFDEEHFHLILNGAYMPSELEKDDQRYAMLIKILQDNHREELNLSRTISQSFVKHTGLPPYIYSSASRQAINVDGDPYLWARNLAANRQYQCPVIYCEPYLQNGTDSHARIMAGDYEGLRFVHGILRPSIFREYTNAITEGLVRIYGKRPTTEP